ncbi:DUF4956 domain-containing protein [Desemzia sp. RIT804]|uniref:DUF4956 domain-containing protein n=1 Tax=Desemzia sp. RIT 804 TaxID=2810209 RepID=UPI0019529246|nr:DUF4956 domain-containing protein [Desemzia sp. RIT 804]MBM6614808.1 DUF4956 domain-containing protein [Desemzia sp. RIT 804]
MNELFNSLYIESTTTFSITSFLICTVVSLILGGLVAWTYMFRNHYSKGFVVTLFLLPAIVEMVIMLVNGNVGAGVAVMGAFSLVRFRSVAGSAKEIASIFLAMALGLATGMGYIAIAVVFAVIICAVMMGLNYSNFGEMNENARWLRVTLPENIDYTTVFEDIFEKYLSAHQMMNVKTTNMGSLFRLEYMIELKDVSLEKELIDELRCKNGNLEIVCGRSVTGREEL